MAKPAVHALKEFCAALHALRRSRRLRRYHQWDGWFLLLKSRRKRLGVRDQVDPLLAQQRLPGRHSAGMDASADGLIQIAVQRQASTRRGSTLEGGLGEVAGLGIEIRCALSVSVAILTVAENTVALVECLAAVDIPY
jgi:hypothetical protein